MSMRPYRSMRQEATAVVTSRIEPVETILARAMSTALFFFILNMIGLGLGPSISGWLIDFFKSDYEDIDSMRYAMTAISCVFIPSIISFLIVAQKLPRDWEVAEKNNVKLAKMGSS